MAFLLLLLFSEMYTGLEKSNFSLNARIILRTNDENDTRRNYKNQWHELEPGDEAVIVCARVLQRLKCRKSSGHEGRV